MKKLRTHDQPAEKQAYEAVLLSGWEDVYRKSQLSLLILLALKDGPKYTAEVSESITRLSNGLQTTDDQSIYRTLRRFTAADIVRYEEIPGGSAPKRKLYSLSETGMAVLERFLQRNIIDFFYEPSVRKLIERK